MQGSDAAFQTVNHQPGPTLPYPMFDLIARQCIVETQRPADNETAICDGVRFSGGPFPHLLIDQQRTNTQLLFGRQSASRITDCGVRNIFPGTEKDGMRLGRGQGMRDRHQQEDTQSKGIAHGAQLRSERKEIQVNKRLYLPLRYSNFWSEMVEEASTQKSSSETPRFIAFYLPQFYPTTYNDAWWGKGFTEWTNVVKARPRFRGHYQPHLPADLGFYDLRLPETRDAQAKLAKQFGVYGFCYYHYWFSGKRILERPLDEVLASGKPDYPFCICWANETWKKTWVGRNTVTLLEQNFSFEDDLEHIRHLLPMLGDSRYIRIEGKPMVLVYRVELLPDPRKTAEIWRTEAIKAGLGDLFLINVQSTYLPHGTSPDDVGFDAAMRFEPRARPAAHAVVRAWRTLKSPIHNDRFTRYEQIYRNWRDAPQPHYRHFECVVPMWDNTPRRPRRAGIIHGSTPELYERWLAQAVERSTPDRDHLQWVFINAWNEWGEGCHLEPCQKWGTAYLEATQRVCRREEAVEISAAKNAVAQSF